MEKYIGPITHAVVNGVKKEFKKEENIDRIVNDVICPLLKKIACQYYNYFAFLLSLLVIIILLQILIIYRTRR